MLTLPCSLIFTPSQFAEVCAANPEAVLELAADGTLIGMTPTGGNTGARKIRLLAQLEN
jgi:Uma2 family endonuclease